MSENTWLRRQAILSQEVKFETQVSERAKGLEERQSPLALEVCADQEDLDGAERHQERLALVDAIHAFHASGNDSDFVGP
jgi:hypothetical protein